MSTQPASMKDLRKQLEAPLHTQNRVQDYCAYAQEVTHIIHANLTDDSPEKKVLLDSIAQFRENTNPDFLKNGTAHDHIIDVSTMCATRILNAASHRENTLPHVFKVPVAPYLRSAVEQYGIAKPTQDTHLYRGGVARILARMHFGYQFNPEDIHHSVKDKDMMVQKPFVMQDLVKMYGTTPRGVKGLAAIDDTSIQQEMQFVDLGMNQVFVSRDFMYYTQIAKESLASHHTQIVASGVDIYRTHDYIKDGQTIHAASPLLRGFKFLIEDKINALEIAAHNIDKHNMELMHLDNDFLVLLRKILDKDSDLGMTAMRRLGILLQDLGLIEHSTDIISRYEQMIANNPHFSLHAASEDTEEDSAAKANWMLSKYIKAVFHVLENRQPDRLDKYEINENNKHPVSLTIHAKDIDSGFQETWDGFRKKYRD